MNYRIYWNYMMKRAGIIFPDEDEIISSQKINNGSNPVPAPKAP